MEKISIETFWRLLHDPGNSGFSLKYRKTDGTFGMKNSCSKSSKRFEGKSTKGKLRYDIIEKGSVLLEDREKDQAFTLRNRLIQAVKLPRTKEWLQIIHKNY